MIYINFSDVIANKMFGGENGTAHHSKNTIATAEFGDGNNIVWASFSAVFELLQERWMNNHIPIQRWYEGALFSQDSNPIYTHKMLNWLQKHKKNQALDCFSQSQDSDLIWKISVQKGGNPNFQEL